MSMPAEKLPFDAHAYLAWEADQPTKNEYLAGEVFAMSGASDAHVTITFNLAVPCVPSCAARLAASSWPA